MYRSFLSRRYLRSRFVNFLSVAGVMAGVAVMIVVTSVMDGFQVKVKQVLRGTLSHLVLTPDGKVPAPAFGDLEQALLKVPGVVGAAPQISAYMAHPYRAGASYRTSSEAYLPMEAVGIDWEREKGVSSLSTYVVHGDAHQPFYNKEAEYRESKTAMFSRAFLEQYAPGVLAEDWVGQKIVVISLSQRTDAEGNETVNKRKYELVVSAVYDAEDQTADLARIYMDAATLREVAHIEIEYSDVHVAVKDYEQVDRIKEQIVGSILGVSAQTWEEVRAPYLKAVNNEKVLLLIVLSFIVLLAGFTILATLTLTVVEKTRDIGLLKAVGATTGGVLSLFLRSGLLIGVIGGILGLGLGIFVSDNVNVIKDGLAKMGIQIFPPDIYLFRDIPTFLDPWSVGWIVVGGIGIAFLAGLPPALRAARMDPIVALRHE